jgi:hypothetical protein
MAAHLDQTTLESGLELPEVRGLPHKERALGAGGEEGPIVRPEIREEVRIARQLEKFATKDHGDHLDIAQLGHETTVPSGISRCERPIMFLYQTVYRNDKSIAVHWLSP